MADYNRKGEPDFGRSDRERQRSRQHSGNYGGAYGQSSYGTRRQVGDSEWDRDEYRQGSIWEREHHLRADRQDRRDIKGDYDEGRSGSYGISQYGSRPASRDRAGGDRDWWDRSRDEVSSWFGDDEAERRRRMDEQRAGAVHRGKGPKGYRRSEERIREDAYDRLTDDDYVDATDIQVQMEGDDVVLTGSVHSREEKRRAEDLVERVSGVRNVQNRLRVERDQSRGTTGSERDRV
jgi:osmotically-inducible protein OsmY